MLQFLCFITQRKFEDACQIPALPLIEKSLTCSFFRFHCFFGAAAGFACWCFDDYNGYGSLYPRRPLHVAIKHDLARSVSAYFANANLLGDVDSNEHRLPFWLSEESCSESLTPIIAEGVESPKHSRFLLQTSFDFFENIPADSEEMGLLEYAIPYAEGATSSQALSILNNILQYNPQVDDDTIIVALATDQTEVTRLMLSKIAKGKHRFVPNQDPHTFQISKFRVRELLLTPSEAGLLSNLRIGNPAFGLLWILARGLSTFENLKELLDFYGEGINDQCSPFGTALHSAINYYHPDEMIQPLINAGGDINAQGLFGNPLEYAWLLLNTESNEYRAFILAKAVHVLIAKGAVNNRKDPNSCIPTQDWMLLVRNLHVAHRQGTEVVTLELWQRCKDLYAGSTPYPTIPTPLPRFIEFEFNEFESVRVSNRQAWVNELMNLLPRSTQRLSHTPTLIKATTYREEDDGNNKNDDDSTKHAGRPLL